MVRKVREGTIPGGAFSRYGTDMEKFDSALSEIKVFATLSETEKAAISRLCDWKRLAPQEQIISHHDPTSDVYFIVQGTVRAVNYSLDGKEVSFRDIQPGAMFGEYAAIDNMPRSATVYAVTDAFVGSLSASDFLGVLERHPTVARTVMQLLTRQIRRLTERVFEFSTLAVNNRIHAEILRLALAAGVRDNVSRIAGAPTHAQIASRVSTHREAVTREMNALARSGIVEKDGRDLVVRDFAGLQDAVALTLGEFSPGTDD